MSPRNPRPHSRPFDPSKAPGTEAYRLDAQEGGRQNRCPLSTAPRSRTPRMGLFGLIRGVFAEPMTGLEPVTCSLRGTSASSSPLPEIAHYGLVRADFGCLIHRRDITPLHILYT